MLTHTHTARRRRLLAVLVLAATALAVAATGGTSTQVQKLEGRAPTAEEIRPSVEAAFSRESYRPGSTARLVLFNHAEDVTLQLFRVGRERARTRGNSEMRGVPVGAPRRMGSSARGRTILVQIGRWETGLYFAKLTAGDGRVGYAPFVLRPARLGEHRVAVVLPTITWQTYNLRDDDQDGRGDSWYAAWKKTTIRLGRPFLNRGVPYNFRRYDLPLLRWLARTGRNVDVLSQADLEAASGAQALADAYDLIVFPGHHEYVTTREYDLVERYRDLGGNLMFLSANNFFWQVVRHGRTIEKTRQWRDLGRPEAALIGVQYRGNDRGTHRGPWIVRRTPAASWAFAGMGLRPGTGFGSGGIEIDQTTSASPDGVQVLAEIPNLFGPGFTAQMTYYGTPAGAKVFAAGAFRLVPSAGDPTARRLLANLWTRLSRS